MSVAVEDTPRRHRITVDEYHRMAEVGLIAPDARVELIEGEIIEMPPIGNPHAATVDQLNGLLHDDVGKRAIIRCQGPVQLGDFSEPQPDFALLARRNDFYRQQRPTSADTLLAIEVSDTSARYDLNRKMALYAKYGIREYWVIELARRRVHIFRAPTEAGYDDVSCTEDPAAMALTALPDITLDLTSLFP
jgi:Uma2 family endonuclease